MPSRTLDLGERADARYAGPVHPRASQPLGAGSEREREREGAEMGETRRKEGGGPPAAGELEAGEQGGGGAEFGGGGGGIPPTPPSAGERGGGFGRNQGGMTPWSL